MMNFKGVYPFLSIVWLAISVPERRKKETIRKLHRTGEAIAKDDLIHRYEKEHQIFYKEELSIGDHIEWPALDHKNLSEYCRKYLTQSVPGRSTDDATGIIIRKILHYEKENTSTANEILVVRCTVKYQYVYYVTRAPEPNCAYTLKSKGHQRHFILTIINKYCDFEDQPLINRTLKRKRSDIVYKLHRSTGQPIAKDKYLLKYELDHQDLLQREGDNVESIDWPHAKEHPNLNFFCYQYMGVSAPRRNREGVKGKWEAELLYYQKMNANKYVKVTTITCQPAEASKLYYRMTRALETNCVYALLQENHTVRMPLVIIYKHCDFEDPDDQQNLLLDHDVFNKLKGPKPEVKEETFDNVQTLQLFPKD